MLTAAQQRLSSAKLSSCVEVGAGDPELALREKALIFLRDTALSIKADWDKRAAAQDAAGDLCNINCCECADSACYSGSFEASGTSPYGMTFSGARGQNIEMILDREDKDSSGRVLQQFYTIERGEFTYPQKVHYTDEFECDLDRTNFALLPMRANLTVFLNNPNFPLGSYQLGFATDGGPTGTCRLKSNPSVSFSIPFTPFTFGFLTECSTYQTVPVTNASHLQGSFANTCSGVTTKVDWSFKSGG